MATDTQFTPGPWHVVSRSSGTGYRHYIHSFRKAVAATYSFESADPAVKARVLANARLIAAAPELYSLAEQFERVAEYELRKMEREKPHDDEGIRLRQLNLNLIRATIAKVRAEQVPA